MLDEAAQSQNSETQPQPQPSPTGPQPEKGRLGFLIFAITLFTIIIGGLGWLFLYSTNSPIGLGWFLFSFASGLSMIILPCTLPLAFVIVPLSLGKGYKKGLSIALAFSIGIVIMLSTYGILAALLGKAVFGFFGGTGETIKNVFYAIAGVFALLFALSELNLIKFRMPSYMGAAPQFIQKRQDIAKALLLGLFLGNIGIGCPHPATPIILGQIGITGDIFYGWLLFFVHAIGRIIPLLLLAILGILGINATKSLMAHKDKISKATAWGMIFVGSFLFTLGFFGHDWWVYSGQHSIFETVVQEERFTILLNQQLKSNVAHGHGVPVGTAPFGIPFWVGNLVFVLLLTLPLWWFYYDEKKRGVDLTIMRLRKWLFLTLTSLLSLIIIYTLPHWFLIHKSQEMHSETETPSETKAIFTTNPEKPMPGMPVELIFYLKDEKGMPLQNLKIEHERILHVLIVSEDFQRFSHIHPEDFEMVTESVLKSSTFKIPHVFPQFGRYLIAINYVHENHEETKLFNLEVGGKTTVVISKDFSTMKNFNGYNVFLETEPEKLLSGEEVSLNYKIEKDGNSVTDMEAYLGAPMHLAVLDVNLSSLAHLHGEIINPITKEERHDVQSGELFGPEIHVHNVFPYPGLYQIFGEFKHNGQIITTSFMVEIYQGKNTNFETMPHGH